MLLSLLAATLVVQNLAAPAASGATTAPGTAVALADRPSPRQRRRPPPPPPPPPLETEPAPQAAPLPEQPTAPALPQPIAPAPSPEPEPAPTAPAAPVPPAAPPPPAAGSAPAPTPPAAETSSADATNGRVAALFTGGVTQTLGTALAAAFAANAVWVVGWLTFIWGTMAASLLYPLAVYVAPTACLVWPVCCAVPPMAVSTLVPGLVGGVGSLASCLGAPLSAFFAGLASGRRLPLEPLALAYMAPTWASYGAAMAVDVVITALGLVAMGGVLYYWLASAGDGDPRRREIASSRMVMSGVAAAGLFVLAPLLAGVVHLAGTGAGVVSLSMLSQRVGRPRTATDDLINLDMREVPPPPPPKAVRPRAPAKPPRPVTPAKPRRPRPAVGTQGDKG